jgi:hypothetical protein
MTLLPAKVLDRKLKWSDFKKTTMDPPSPGTPQISAETSAQISNSAIQVDPVKNKKPEVYRASKANITVTFDNTSWVASYVLDDWAQDKQDALLLHEQTHFMIAACFGRDLQGELDAISAKDFSSSGDGVAEVTAALNKYNQPALQAIQNKYDADTKSSPSANPTVQAKWNTTVEDARANKKELVATLKTAQLIP